MGKTRFLIMLVVILLTLLLVLSGCEDFSFEGCDVDLNYITVVVQGQVCAEVGQIQWEGAQVSIEINKAGGERVTFDKTTDTNGCTDIVEGTFKVYKEQYVEIIARPVTGKIPQDYWYAMGEEYNPAKHRVLSNSKRLLWNKISEGKKFGDTYYWNPILQMMLMEN